MNQKELENIAKRIVSGETDIEEKLKEIISHLSVNNPEMLMAMLYQLDIDESKIKHLLNHTPENAAQTIAQLIIQREIQKQETRKLYDNIDYSGYEDTL